MRLADRVAEACAVLSGVDADRPCTLARRRSVLNPRRRIFWAVLLSALHSCGGSGGGTSQTWLATTITYTGSKSGTAYIKIVSDDGGRTFSEAGPEPSIDALMLVENGFVTCYGFINRVDIPFTGAVWIDVSGTAAGNCSTNVLAPQCQPAPTDPQAHQSGVLRFGQTTRFCLDVVDPP